MALYELDGIAPWLEHDVWVAPTAQVIGRVKLERQSSVWFGAVIRGDSDSLSIGPRTNIQDNAVLHVDHGAPLVLGEGVTVGHAAMLHGCTIGNNSLVGMMATVLSHSKIGSNCIIGAGALITERQSFPDNSLIIGVPAKVVRVLSDESVAAIRRASDHYVANAARFHSGLKLIQA